MRRRYRLSRRKQIIAEHFDAPFEDDWIPRYDIAPTQPIPVIRKTPNFRELTLLRWGLIPSWATDPSIGSRTINARSETITTSAIRSGRDAASSLQMDSTNGGFQARF